MSKIVVTAHAGCEGTADNTWNSIVTAKESGCDVVELDVRKRNGEMLLSHNEIREGDRPVRLEDAFNLLRDSGKRINCDLKEEGIFEDVKKMAEKTGVIGNLLYTGSVTTADIEKFETERGKIFFNVENLFTKEETEKLREAGGSLDETKLHEVFETYKKLGLTGMNIYFGLVDEKLLAAAKEYGVRVAVWTVDEEADMKTMMKLPIFGVTTRRVKKWIELEGK
ncbi:MAG: glycerophosphodiester phosphodiesterase [Lachnospiraceae bacterium]|jgi:glycerophosphoryl diester phosphodiesterase|nr:glycerophosphodiester phosphodiesterase [Lachnospiraceae bacterium]